MVLLAERILFIDVMFIYSIYKLVTHYKVLPGIKHLSERSLTFFENIS